MQDSKFDVFLSHNSNDKLAVEEIKQRLESYKTPFRCWLDKNNLRSCGTWMTQIEDILRDCESAALFFGPTGVGPIHDLERQKLVDRAARQRNSFWLVPVLLPGAKKEDIGGFTSLFNWVDFSAGLDSSAALERLAYLLRGEAPGMVSADDEINGEPYRGLERFDGQHASFFFGRDEEIRRLCSALDKLPFVAVIGASGSGKSSLVRAGLHTSLAHGLLPKLPTATTITVFPGTDPRGSLAEQLAATVLPDVRRDERPRLADDYKSRFQQPSGLVTVLKSLYIHDTDFVILFVDQFEELFTHQSNSSRNSNQVSKDTDSFLSLLSCLAASQDNRFRIVITLRADFIERCLAYSSLLKMLEGHQLLLGEMGAEGMHDAIVIPAQRFNAYLEKGLAERLMTDVTNHRGVLPLLQHSLRELWQHRSGRWMTNEAYTQMGGVAGALQRTADEAFNNLVSLHPNAETIARQVLVSLTAFGEGTPDTRRRIPRAQLFIPNAEPEVINAVVEHLVASRLIQSSSEGSSGSALEITHEALIQAWPRFQTWLADDKQREIVYRRLEKAANDWTDAGQDPGLLLRGSRLADAVSWRRGFAGRPPQAVTRLLTQSEMLQRVQHPVLSEEVFPAGLSIRYFRPGRKLTVACRRQFNVRSLFNILVFWMLCTFLGTIIAIPIAVGTNGPSSASTAPLPLWANVFMGAWSFFGLAYPFYRSVYRPEVEIDLLQRRVKCPHILSQTAAISSDVQILSRRRHSNCTLRLLIKGFEVLRLQSVDPEYGLSVLRPFAYALNHELGFGPVNGDGEYLTKMLGTSQPPSQEGSFVHEHEELVDRYFKNIQNSDWLRVRECLGKEAEIVSCEFNLDGQDIEAMWRMESEWGMTISVHSIRPKVSGAVAKWNATYRDRAKRKVYVVPVVSDFVILDGVIRFQQDTTPRYRWAFNRFGVLGWFAAVTGDPLFFRWVRRNGRLRIQQFHTGNSMEETRRRSN